MRTTNPVASALLIGSLLAGTVLVGPASAVPDQPAPHHDHLAVTAYALAGSARPAEVAASAARTSVVGVDGVVLAGPARVSVVGAKERSLRRAAHRHGLPAVLLFGNYDSRIGDFSEPLAHRMLASPGHRTRVVDQLISRVRNNGFDGVQLDLESLRPRDRAALVAFTRELRQRLPRPMLSMAVMASTSRAGYRHRGYDLPALGRHLDSAVLMAYDLHGPGWSAAGPIGPLPWVRRAVAAFGRLLPASKIDLGIAGYGYRWADSGRSALTVAQARRLGAAAGTTRWDPRSREWTATLSGGVVIWWSDSRSITVRERLARALGLHGVAIWELGSVDRLP